MVEEAAEAQAMLTIVITGGVVKIKVGSLAISRISSPFISSSNAARVIKEAARARARAGARLGASFCRKATSRLRRTSST